MERERQERENMRHQVQEIREIREHEEREREREREKRREMELKRDRLPEERSAGLHGRGEAISLDRDEEGVSPPPSKRTHMDSDESPEPVLTGTALLASVAATNIKITSQGKF